MLRFLLNRRCWPHGNCKWHELHVVAMIDILPVRFTLINGMLTFATAIAFWLYFPDSVSTAWFLTENERKLAVERVREHETGRLYEFAHGVVKSS